MTRSPTISCPDCEEPLAFTFFDTSGVGAHKRGDNFNTTPDTAHYICFLCEKAWKQRLSGPLTSDVVGDLAFFCCRVTDCGNRLAVVEPSETFTEIVLACSRGHRHAVVAGDGGGLVIAPA